MIPLWGVIGCDGPLPERAALVDGGFQVESIPTAPSDEAGTADLSGLVGIHCFSLARVVDADERPTHMCTYQFDDPILAIQAPPLGPRGDAFVWALVRARRVIVLRSPNREAAREAFAILMEAGD